MLFVYIYTNYVIKIVRSIQTYDTESSMYIHVHTVQI